MKIALLGAESTGKTQLAHALTEMLCRAGQSAIAVDEHLRQWCDQHARTPRQDEQADIANTQRDRIEAACLRAEHVIADTTPVMTAIYSEFIFGDESLTPPALSYQSRFDLTLVTGLDLPWEADGIQRDGEHVRAPVDALLRHHLQTAGIAFEVIYGIGPQRIDHAWQAIARANQRLHAQAGSALDAPPPLAKKPDQRNWQWHCDKCSDSDCEHRLFRTLTQSSEGQP